ncbi:hypothetical protein Tco_0748025 [Tanacetum coccineum]|uniref:Uncharacterized protein n=1 Tax=Tanacetum coccineum TaxID=301880 RepID=A0ABQ4YUF9_9ASTR
MSVVDGDNCTPSSKLVLELILSMQREDADYMRKVESRRTEKGEEAMGRYEKRINKHVGKDGRIVMTMKEKGMETSKRGKERNGGSEREIERVLEDSPQGIIYMGGVMDERNRIVKTKMSSGPLGHALVGVRSVGLQEMVPQKYDSIGSESVSFRIGRRYGKTSLVVPGVLLGGKMVILGRLAALAPQVL